MVFTCLESARDGSEPSHALNIVDNVTIDVKHRTVGVVEHTRA
jgi:hypothetical protein